MKSPPKSKHGIAHSNNPEVVRQQIKGSLSSISIGEARRIAEELKANRRIWFTPPLTAAQIANEIARLHSERWRERNGKRSNKTNKRR